MTTRRISDYFKYTIVQTATGPEARRSNVAATVPAEDSVLFMNYRTSGFRTPTGYTFTVKDR